ncbi:hypothetical protein BCR43DRAFT_499776 [Syncephalastrum racemosum]|uniref:F-box domain-containing protein n=1 Tax=Syncephalastrum racemosum TaxID=13706 RepID=A0A1X2GZM0_SYNRA|nr:hypothetical protein BCR43DRAFT_499776 [Syncephalastrum racemosum]
MTTKDETESWSLEDGLGLSLKKAIEENNTDVAESLCVLLSHVLESKIRQSLNACDYSTALQRTEWLLQVRPSSPSPILLFCEIYVRLGWLDYALEMCYEGASFFSEKSVFRDRIDWIMQYKSERRDPMQCFPPELVTRIFEFAPEKRITSRCVSRLWRDTLDQLPIWRRLTINRDNSNLFLEFGSAADIDIPPPASIMTPALQHLTWSTFYPPSYVIQSLDARGCTQLQSLNFTMKTNSPFSAVPDPDFCYNIRHLGDHLTDLTVDVPYHQRYVIRRLLASLPQLVSLKYYHRFPERRAEEADLHVDDALPQGPLKLKYLQCLGEKWPPEDFTGLAPLVPELVSFIVRPDPDPDHTSASWAITGEFMEHCPQLETLIWKYSIQPYLDILSRPGGPTIATDTFPEADLSPGVRHLILDSGLQVNDMTLYDFMREHQATLEALYCAIEIHVPFGQDRVLPQLEFPRLRWLSIGFCLPRGCDTLSSLPSICPRLEALRLKFLDFALTTDDVRPLSQFSRLHSLRINSCSFESADTLLTLFEGIIASHCPLLSLELSPLYGDELVTNSVLDALGRITSLKRLVISTEERALSKDNLDAFLNSASESGLAKSLEYLDFFKFDMMPRALWCTLLYSTFTKAHIALNMRQLRNPR